MKFAATFLFIVATTFVDGFQPIGVSRNIHRVSTRQPSLLFSEPAKDSDAEVVVLDDVDGVGAVLDKTDVAVAAVSVEQADVKETASVDVIGSTVEDVTGSTTEEVKEAPAEDVMGTPEADILQLLVDVEVEATKATEELMDEECVLDVETGDPVDELCAEGEEREGFRAKLKKTISRTLSMVRGMPDSEEDSEDDAKEAAIAVGDVLEEGWKKRGGSSALRRNGEVWKFALKSVFRALKPRSMRKKGASDAEVKAAQIEAATFIRDGLLTLGPTFVKLGQVSFLPFCLSIQHRTLACRLIGCDP